MPSKNIIMRSPNNYPLCDKNCIVERGTFFVVNKKEWEKIYDFIDSYSFPTEDDDYFEFNCCSRHNACEFMKNCTIVNNKPSKELIKFVDDAITDDFFDDLQKIVKKYEDSDDE